MFKIPDMFPLRVVVYKSVGVRLSSVFEFREHFTVAHFRKRGEKFVMRTR